MKADFRPASIPMIVVFLDAIAQALLPRIADQQGVEASKENFAITAELCELNVRMPFEFRLLGFLFLILITYRSIAASSRRRSTLVEELPNLLRSWFVCRILIEV